MTTAHTLGEVKAEMTAKPNKVLPFKRRCKRPDCRAFLCRYNDGDECWHHGKQAVERDPQILSEAA